MVNVGTDILEIDSIPSYKSMEEMTFFNNNYTSEEIRYALSKKNPRTEFARLFSIKESLVKTSENLRKKNFNQINLIQTGNNISYPHSAITSSISNNVCISVVINHNTQYVD